MLSCKIIYPIKSRFSYSNQLLYHIKYKTLNTQIKLLKIDVKTYDAYVFSVFCDTIVTISPDISQNVD